MFGSTDTNVEPNTEDKPIPVEWEYANFICKKCFYRSSDFRMMEGHLLCHATCDAGVSAWTPESCRSILSHPGFPRSAGIATAVNDIDSNQPEAFLAVLKFLDRIKPSDTPDSDTRPNLDIVDTQPRVNDNAETRDAVRCEVSNIPSHCVEVTPYPSLESYNTTDNLEEVSVKREGKEATEGWKTVVKDTIHGWVGQATVLLSGEKSQKLSSGTEK
ncbi:hypothetical protein EDC01DRAFT_634157 [Geopyxis carbonaria]|nr:hypothetical protein EDC01DRAFT_634157 [Geopyxis carbonaria]